MINRDKIIDGDLEFLNNNFLKVMLLLKKFDIVPEHKRIIESVIRRISIDGINKDFKLVKNERFHKQYSLMYKTDIVAHGFIDKNDVNQLKSIVRKEKINELKGG